MADFAKLVPVTVEAQQLFSKSVQSMQQRGDAFHLKFIQNAVFEDEGDKLTLNERLDASSEYASSTPSEPDIYRGHYLLSLQTEKLPERADQGWRVGKGTSHATNQNVDFLMAPPRDSKRKQLAVLHMFLRFNVNSGMLMLVAASPDRPVHVYIEGEWIALRHPAKRVLHLRSNRLRLGECEYDLVYTVPLAEMTRFFAMRKAHLSIFSDRPSPSDDLWSIPPNAELRRLGATYVCKTKACGGFGWVYEGVHSHTGDPVAVKEMGIKDNAVRDQVLAEAEMGKTFQVSIARNSIASLITLVEPTWRSLHAGHLV